jgi:hypothetical protein
MLLTGHFCLHRHPSTFSIPSQCRANTLSTEPVLCPLAISEKPKDRYLIVFMSLFFPSGKTEIIFLNPDSTSRV